MTSVVTKLKIDEPDRQEARKGANFLEQAASLDHAGLFFVRSSGEKATVELPPQVLEALRAVLDRMAKHEEVLLLNADAELTSGASRQDFLEFRAPSSISAWIAAGCLIGKWELIAACFWTTSRGFEASKTGGANSPKRWPPTPTTSRATMRNRLKVLLDANVLFSNQQRNLLLQLASQEVIDVVWTAMIEDEWLRNTEIRTRKRIISRTLPLIRDHFPSALIEGFDPSAKIGSTDEGDRHVASAAVKSAPCVLITRNIGHFDVEELAKYGINVETPDAFLSALYDADPNVVHDVTRAAQANLTKSAPTWETYLENLSHKQGLKGFADRLSRFEPLTQQDINLNSTFDDTNSTTTEQQSSKATEKT